MALGVQPDGAWPGRPPAARRVQSDAEVARQLSLEDPSDLSLFSSAWWLSASALRTRPGLQGWAAELVRTVTGGTCRVWSLFIALAVLASFATRAAWQGIAKAVGLTQLDGIEASGVCRIELSGAVGEDGTDMSGWELTAQRAFRGDRRDNFSTYASVQNLEEWAKAGVWWEVAPHVEEPGAYRIRIRHVADELEVSEEIGWYLGASTSYTKDERGLFSVYASIVSEPTMTLADDSDVDERVESLTDENRTAPWHDASVASSAWILVPLNEAGAYNIRLKTGPPGVEEMAGWYLSARRWFKRERRNEDSTYVSLVRDEEDAATWILTCSSCCVGLDTGTDGDTGADEDEFPSFYQ